MSIPSSSDAVATTADELAALERLLGRPALVQAQAAVVGPERADRVITAPASPSTSAIALR